MSRTGRSCGYPATSVARSQIGPGLITFGAEDDQQAQRAVDTDPFVQEGLLAAHWLKQWTPQ
jgi:hypothetical protein